MKLVQFISERGERSVGVIEHDQVRPFEGIASVYELAVEALTASGGLNSILAKKKLGKSISLAVLMEEKRLLSPIDHPDPAHLYVSGTGLTHLGSASARDAMHQSTKNSAGEQPTDSMKMFSMGVEHGKPLEGEIGIQPEWFYKGNGHSIVAPEHELSSPSFALDAGEEPEIAGIYIIDGHGRPRRLGFALANEFSDHVTERQNYLYLAHSKLRQCALGPALLMGELPDHIQGTSRILRDGQIHWQNTFLSGETNMSHTIANLEYHHFKYDIFRTPGDLHVHMFGTATLSFSDGVRTQAGDVFEIDCPTFGPTLRNGLRVDEVANPVVINL